MCWEVITEREIMRLFSFLETGFWFCKRSLYLSNSFGFSSNRTLVDLQLVAESVRWQPQRTSIYKQRGGGGEPSKKLFPFIVTEDMQLSENFIYIINTCCLFFIIYKQKCEFSSVDYQEELFIVAGCLGHCRLSCTGLFFCDFYTKRLRDFFFSQLKSQQQQYFQIVKMLTNDRRFPATNFQLVHTFEMNKIDKREQNAFILP